MKTLFAVTATMITQQAYHLFIKPERGEPVNMYFDVIPTREEALEIIGDKHSVASDIIRQFGINLGSQELSFAGLKVGYMRLAEFPIHCRRLK